MGQGGLACCSPRGRKELDSTELSLNDTYFNINMKLSYKVTVHINFFSNATTV